jgi:hypothetical protein
VMGSSERWVGRLRGGSCGNNRGGNIVALAVARLGGAQHNESMWGAGRGQAGSRQHDERGRWMTSDVGQAGGEQHGKRGG